MKCAAFMVVDSLRFLFSGISAPTVPHPTSDQAIGLLSDSYDLIKV